ncbi:MAG: response regulator [Woeseiaceae bacterium]
MNQLLLVNDDDDIRNRTAAMIIDLGWEVYVADGEDKVFESIVARRPDLMIVDIEIECGGGYEAISTARRLFPDLFIIAVTRGGHKSLWLEAVCQCGANIYVVGPVSKSKLAGAINFGLRKGRVLCGMPQEKGPSLDVE